MASATRSQTSAKVAIWKPCSDQALAGTRELPSSLDPVALSSVLRQEATEQGSAASFSV